MEILICKFAKSKKIIKNGWSGRRCKEEEWEFDVDRI